MKGKLISTDPRQQHFFVERALMFSPRDKGGAELIKVFPHHVFQRIDGFGGSFTEGAGVVFNSMSAKTKTQFLDDYFSPQKHAYSLARMPIQSCDFSLGNYAYVESATELERGHLSFERDKANLIPLVSAAVRVNPKMALMASPWSPPGFMKTNNDMNGGGKLRREYYNAWAEIIIQYLLEYQRHGISVTSLSIQNEPVAVKTWDSCLYSVEEETEFAVKYLRPVLARYGMDEMEIYIWDHDKDGLVDWAEHAFASDENYAGINGMAFHWYTGDHFSQLQYLAQCLPDKKMLFSEGCVPMEHDDGSQLRHWHTYLHDMIGNFKAGCTGFIDWNLLLDARGGPNHQGNLCEAPIQYDKERDELRYNLSWYGIGHFSRYVQPGAKVMLSSSFDSQLEEVGFVNPDGERVLVIYNREAGEKSCRVVEGDKEYQVTLPGYGVATLLWREEEE
ncbi:glycoside hydrolase family 30 protein [Citrobacter braakii]|jgi:glucosylceramidase|uniref:glycoside hydrolase family 30 protein n=1 Tax=Citrobacter braakii TaxID=57706 RepID=UPI003D98E473